MKVSDYNICSVCGKAYQYRRRWFPIEIFGVGHIKKLESYTAHSYCTHLWRQKEEKERELVNIEWEIHQLQNK